MDLSADAVIAAASFPQHDRTTAHSGYEDDNDVILSAAIGPYPAGTTLDVFLAGLWTTLAAVGNADHHVGLFSANAVITGGTFRADAILAKASGTKTFGAAWQWGPGGSFTVAAWIQLPPVTMTADAILVGNIC